MPNAVPAIATRVLRESVLLLAVAMITWSSTVEAAGESQASSDAQIGSTALRPRGKWLADRGPFDPRPHEGTVFGDGLLTSRYFDEKNRLWVEKGISFGGYVSANTQWGSEGGRPHHISETLIMLTWEPKRSATSVGRLVIGFAHDWTFGRPTTRAFANTQGLVETPNDLDTDPELTFTTLGLLHWEHEQFTGPDRGWGFRAGQLYAPSYFGSARYIDDDRRYFMARPVAAAAGAQWVGFNDIGLGVNAIAWRSPWYVSAAAMDGKANRNYPDFPSLFDGELLYLGEIGFERDSDGANESAVRLTFSHLDVRDGANPDKGPGQSVMLSGDKRFQGRWGLAGRYSRSFDRLSADYRGLASLGLLWLVPFDRSPDIAGLGLFAGEPSDASRGVESGVEMFYRLRLTQGIGVMPDVQYWWRDDSGGVEARTWVWGIRSELEF